MKNYSESDYNNLFEKFFNDDNNLQGPHKCVFLHALTYVSLIDKDDLIRKEWITQNDTEITLDLDFIAIRFIKVFHEMLNLDIKYSPALKNRPTVFSILEEYKEINFPTLAHLVSPKWELLRKEIIGRGIKPEVLRNLVEQTNKEKPPDFPGMYDWTRGTNTIKFKKKLVDFIESKRDYLRYRLGKKLREYLEELNPNKKISESFVSLDNPFYQYVMKQQRLFLVCIEQNDEKQRFEQSMKNTIMLEHVEGFDNSVFVWGMDSTHNNNDDWNNIRQGDIILFSNNNLCFAKGIVQQTVQNTEEAIRRLGKNVELHDRLIIFESVVFIQLDLRNYRIQLIKSTTDKNNFTIFQVDNELLSQLFSTYYNIETALDSISEPITNDIHNVSVSLVEGKAKIRRGQDAFRKKVLTNYNKICAVCDINQEELLEASHILEVKNQESAGDIKNGICLCVLHHKMFDRRYMYFDIEYTLKFTSKSTEDLRSTCIKMKITESTCSEKPSKEYLQKSSDLIKYQES